MPSKAVNASVVTIKACMHTAPSQSVFVGARRPGVYITYSIDIYTMSTPPWHLAFPLMKYRGLSYKITGVVLASRTNQRV